jgi:hypothetical protein
MDTKGARPRESHLHYDHAALGHRVAPLVMIHSGIAVTRPLRVGKRKLDPWTITASTIFFATTDFIDDPWLEHRNAST